MRKLLSWVARCGYPGCEEFEIGNLETYDFDPAEVRMQFLQFIKRCLPDGFELKGFRRGRLEFNSGDK